MKAHQPRLSIIITSHNQLNSLKFTMLALKDQAPMVDHEILVVDCGSDDGSAQFLADRAEKDGIRLIETVGRPGRTAARNQGAMAAHGRYLMFLDPGMVVGPHWSDSLVHTLDVDGQVVVTAGRILVPDGRIDHAGYALLAWRTPDENHIGGRSLYAGRLAEALGPLGPRLVHGLASEAMAVRATAFFAVGGFSEDLGADHVFARPLGEAEPAGLDLCLKLRDRGGRCVFNPASIMTRLRLAEQADVQGRPDGSVVSHDLTADTERFTQRWRDTLQPDFIVHRQGVTPCDANNIRTYLEPVIDFRATGREGMVHPHAMGIDFDGEPTTASIILLTHNQQATLERTLPALLRHTDPRHELILVDGGSTDGTVEYLQEITLGRANCQLILLDEDTGYAAGCNLGMAGATGDHLVLLKPDVMVTPQWLEKLVTAAEARSHVGLCAPLSNLATGGQAAGDIDYDARSLHGLDLFAADLADRNTGKTEQAVYAAASCLLIKRELVARIGGLDEGFVLGRFEGIDFSLRARLAGYDVHVVQDSYVHHTGAGNVDVDLETLDRIQQMWEIFKGKWDLPAEQALSAPLDLAKLLETTYDASRHFQALTGHVRVGVADSGAAATRVLAGKTAD